jgi:uncharacterized protein (DUF697 family)
VRIAVYILLACNVTFAAWAMWVDVPAPAAASTVKVTPLQLASATKTIKTHCMTLGPFANAARSVAAAAALEARGVGSLARHIERKVVDGTLVYVGGLETMMARQRALQQLREAGITDVADVSGSVYPDRISAGLFSDRGGANVRARKVTAAGLTPTLEEHRRTVQDQWLNVDVNAETDPPAAGALGLDADSAAAVSWSECPAAAASG